LEQFKKHKEKHMPTEKEIMNSLSIYLAQLQNMTPLEPSDKDFSDEEHEQWMAKNQQIEQIVHRAELEALRLLPPSAYQLVKQIWNTSSALYSPPEQKVYQHVLHFHARATASGLLRPLMEMNLPLRDVRIEEDTKHTIRFETDKALDTGTIILIVEKTRPLSSAFNEEADEEEEEPVDFVKEMYDKADYDATHKDNDAQGNPLVPEGEFDQGRADEDEERAGLMDTATLRIWHHERKTRAITAYYVLLASEAGTASLIITYDAAKSAATCDVFVPPDIDYTIHDGCDHEHDECFENHPDSSEYQDVCMATMHHAALVSLEKQVKQARRADELRADKSKSEQGIPGPGNETHEDGFASPEA
jgi:hypothetical protein